jgi:hypothetical protein
MALALLRPTRGLTDTTAADLARARTRVLAALARAAAPYQRK